MYIILFSISAYAEVVNYSNLTILLIKKPTGGHMSPQQQKGASPFNIEMEKQGLKNNINIVICSLINIIGILGKELLI